MIKKYILCLTLFCLSIVDAQNFNGGYNFYIPPYDSSNQEFLPYFPVNNITSFIQIDNNGHFSANGNRIKFWGINLVSEGAFINKLNADKIAGRIRKMGFNLVRFHHIDNPWGSGSLFYGLTNTRALNQTKLDVLHYTIAKLKENGIYSNINLNVSRTFKVTDGIAYADSLPEFGKYVTIFDKNLISLEKEYASQLLNALNPYTGVSLKDDPAMAMVEIINENSIFRAWRDGLLTTKQKGGILSFYHTKMLDSLWNNFLFNKYNSNENLDAAWNLGLSSSGINMINDWGFENSPITSYWFLEQHSGATGSITKDIINPYSGFLSAKVTVNNATGTYWHLQFRHTSLSTKKDSTYLIKFAARSNTDKKIYVAISLQDDPYTFFAGKEFQISTNWQVYSFTYTGSQDAINKTKLAFQFSSNGIYWFDNISFTTAPVYGLLENENLDQKNIQRNSYTELKSFSEKRVKDNSEFYIYITNSFFNEMINYLKNTLNVKVPIVGTNWNIGFQDLISQSEADYIDNHSYWDHPQFPGIPWSNTDWIINNTSMTKAIGSSTIPGLFAGVKIKGKPYTISEYNHPFPNRFQAEAPLFIAGYSSFHDIDGIMYFDYNSVYDFEADKISNYFSIHNNPLFTALNPSMAFAFRNDLISKGETPYEIKLAKDDILKLPFKDNENWDGYKFFDKNIAFAHRTEVTDFNSPISTDFTTFPSFNQSVISTDNNEIIINSSGLLSINSPKFIGLTGYLNELNNFSFNNFKIINCSDFGSLSIIPLSNDSIVNASKILLTIVSKVQNTGMVWNGINTINNNWGSSPTLMNPLIINCSLKLNADSIYIYPLNNIGKANYLLKKIVYPNQDGYFNITVDQNTYKSPWFGIKSFTRHTTFIETEYNSFSFKLENNYPNPFNASTNISFTIPNKSLVKLTIFDILGNKIKTLLHDEMFQGKYTIQWNGTNDDNSIVSSGVYLIKLETNNFSNSIKAVLLK